MLDFLLAVAGRARVALLLPGHEETKAGPGQNGFITLNLPLTLQRLGAYSTSTNHPLLLELDAAPI
jgi:hypothetical protein